MQKRKRYNKKATLFQKKTKLLFVLLCLSFFPKLLAQKQSRQIGLISDNDLYVSLSQDRYYTNGLRLTYRYLTKKQSNQLSKRILSFELGHQMYTPYKATVRFIEEHDRPFAAYLYAGAKLQSFYRNNKVIHFGLNIGIIGEKALGKELQRMVHFFYPFRKTEGWKYQIANAFVVNFNALYLQPITARNKKRADLYWLSKAQLGTIFTSMSTGFYTRLGINPLKPMHTSLAMGGELNHTMKKNTPELFLFLQSQVHYKFYDATIEGSFFNQSSKVTYAIKPWVWTAEFGLRVLLNRFNVGYSICFYTQKIKSKKIKPNNFYGKIQLNYSF